MSWKAIAIALALIILFFAILAGIAVLIPTNMM